MTVDTGERTRIHLGLLTVLANAQTAVTVKLTTHLRGLIFAGLVPAAAATLVSYWAVES